MVIYGEDVHQLKELSKFLATGTTRLPGKAHELDSLIGHGRHRQGRKPNRGVPRASIRTVHGSPKINIWMRSSCI